MIIKTRLLAAGAALALITPTAAFACACGCGLFDVGDGTVGPVASDSGLSAWLRYDYVDQDRNRQGSARAPAADNPDKRIDTSFFTAGAEYMINRRWTVMAELPLYRRHFTTAGADGPGGPPVETAPLTALGDGLIRLTYTGFSADLTNGLSLAIKLPTGRDTSPVDRFGGQPYDRDTLPGTGSTDLQVGGYHVGAVARRLNWFVQAQYQFAIATRDGYRPGNELNGGLGLSYDLAHRSSGVGIAPTLKLVGSVRARDTGWQADALNSGYRRLMVAPGVKFQLTRKLSIYGDVAIPVAQYVNAAGSSGASSLDGDRSGQLVSPVMLNVQINYGF